MTVYSRHYLALLCHRLDSSVPTGIKCLQEERTLSIKESLGDTSQRVLISSALENGGISVFLLIHYHSSPEEDNFPDL